MLLKLTCEKCNTKDIILRESEYGQREFICKNPVCENFNLSIFDEDQYDPDEIYPHIKFTIKDGVTKTIEYKKLINKNEINFKEIIQDGEIKEVYLKENNGLYMTYPDNRKVTQEMIDELNKLLEEQESGFRIRENKINDDSAELEVYYIKCDVFMDEDIQITVNRSFIDFVESFFDKKGVKNVEVDYIVRKPY